MANSFIINIASCVLFGGCNCSRVQAVGREDYMLQFSLRFNLYFLQI